MVSVAGTNCASGTLSKRGGDNGDGDKGGAGGDGGNAGGTGSDGGDGGLGGGLGGLGGGGRAGGGWFVGIVRWLASAQTSRLASQSVLMPAVRVNVFSWLQHW